MTTPRKKIPSKKVRDILLADPAQIPHLGDIVEHFFRIAGGSAAVAQMLYDEFLAAAPGSLVRSRVLDIITRALKTTDAGTTLGDLSMLSDNDLERELNARMATIGDLLTRDESGQEGLDTPGAG